MVPSELEQTEGSKLSSQSATPNEDGKTTMDHKGGGWTTFPFIIGSMTGLSLVAGGWGANLIVFLINEFHVKSITATQINNVILGCNYLLPIAGAIVADTFFDSYTVIITFAFVSLLGMILLTLTTTINSLKPLLCAMGASKCPTPSKLQFAVLYIALALASLGVGGTRFTIATMGADQFDDAKDQGIFFNWYFLALYIANCVSLTALIYIQDNVSWGLAFGICTVLNAIALVLFLSGKRFYRRIKPKRSPFLSILCVIFAAIRKRNVPGTFDSQDYYYGSVETTNIFNNGPSKSLRFLNCAALKIESEDSQSSRSNARSWKLCTVEEVEDLKTLFKIMPLWSSSILLSTTIGVLNSLAIVQVLTMDRHLGPHFKIPAGSFIMFNLLATALSIFIIDRFLHPAWQKFIPIWPLTPLRRIGIGHIINILAMMGFALIEMRRLHVVRTHQRVTNQFDYVVPISGLWLVVPLTILGIGEAFHFPGQIALYYQEFPKSLKGTSTAMISLLIAIGLYLSTVIIDLVRKITGWLPDNINYGRLDNVFWMLAVIGVVNLGYYLVCAKLFKYQNLEKSNDSGSHVH